MLIVVFAKILQTYHIKCLVRHTPPKKTNRARGPCPTAKVTQVVSLLSQAHDLPFEGLAMVSVSQNPANTMKNAQKAIQSHQRPKKKRDRSRLCSAIGSRVPSTMRITSVPTH